MEVIAAGVVARISGARDARGRARQERRLLLLGDAWRGKQKWRKKRMAGRERASEAEANDGGKILQLMEEESRR